MLIDCGGLQNRLSSGRDSKKVLGGTWLNSGSVTATEIAAMAGFDWLLIDREHGSGSEADVAMQCLAAAAHGSSSVIRVSGIVPGEIKRVLDEGPAGIMIPSVDTVEQASDAVRHVRLPPLGIRQTATSTRATGYGRAWAHYRQHNNRELVLMVQIESVAAVEYSQEIAAIAGVDVLFVGPTDLASSMGLESGAGDAAFDEAVASVAAAAARHGKESGILARTEEQARQYAALGFRWIAHGSDRGILASGFDRAARMLQSLGAGG